MFTAKLVRRCALTMVCGTGNPILNDHVIVTRYDGAWVHANAGDAPGVQPASKPSHRPRKGMQWNGKATAIRNTEGELTVYAGAWVPADAEDQTSTVEPAARPGGRPPTGKVWNGKAHATMNAEGMITDYTGEYVDPRPHDVSSVVFHSTDTFYLPSPFPLTLCVLINKKGVDTMTFRLTGKSPRQNLKTKSMGAGGPIFWWATQSRFLWWAPQARFSGGRRRPDFLGSQFESQRDFLTF